MSYDDANDVNSVHMIIKYSFHDSLQKVGCAKLSKLSHIVCHHGVSIFILLCALTMS